MTLSEAEVKTFISNVLGTASLPVAHSDCPHPSVHGRHVFCVAYAGERISDAKAEEYLQALDFDRDGVVDFADILSWAAVMKIDYEKRHESSLFGKAVKRLLRASKDANIPQVCILLAMCGIARDMFVRHQDQLVKSKALRILGYLASLLYVLKMLSASQQSVSNVWEHFIGMYKTVVMLKTKLLSK